MPEWLNGTLSKSVEPSQVPRVRIPLSPQKIRNLNSLLKKRGANESFCKESVLIKDYKCML